MADHQNRSFSFEEFELDASKRRLTRSGESVALHSKGFDLLTLLVENNGQILTKERIFSEIWQDRFVEESNLVVQISNLRKALGETRSSPRFLITVPGKGYKFSANVRVHGDLDETAREVAAEITKANTINTPSSRPRPVSRLFAGVAICLIAVVAVGLYFVYRPQAAARSSWADSSSRLQRRQLTANGNVNVAALSPDGSLFAYTTEGSEESGLWVAGVDGNQTIEILAPEQRLFYGLTFSPDGKHIYYSMMDEKIRKGLSFAF